jgi:predicted permease
VISDSLWKRQYGGDPEVVGEEIRLNGLDYTLLGVMPEDFEFYSHWYSGRPFEIWAPLVFDEEDRQGRRSYSYLQIGRLKDGVGWAAAQAELDSIARSLAAEYPDDNARTRFWLVPAVTQIVSEPAGTLIVLLGTVGFVLLIACSNVASMLLARGAGRQTEVAVRVSLGAARRRIIAQLLTESVMLSVLGGVAGVALASWSLDTLRALIPPEIPRVEAISVNTTVLVFTLGLTLATGLIFGLAPAITAVRTDIVGALKEGGGGRRGVRARNRWLRRFAVAQIALALVLTNGAVILFESYRNLLGTPHAFDAERSLTGEIWLWGPEYTSDEAKVRFWNDFTAQLEALPGIEHAAVASKLPLQGGTSTSILVNDETFDPSVRRTNAERSLVSPGYFDAIGIRLINGRDLRATDDAPAEYGVVVNRTLAEHAWPGESAVGQLIRSNDNPPPWTAVVVGVVEDVRQWSERQPRPEIYFPYATRPWVRGRLVVRTSGDPLDALPSIRAQLARIDADLPLAEVRTLGAIVNETTRHRRFLTLLVQLFTITAVVLAIVGIYGNMSYHVARRTHEIGVRVALGAGQRSLLVMVLRHALFLATVGVAIGLGLTAAFSLVAGHWAYGVNPLSPLYLTAGTLFVLAVALLAAWIPAQRAAQVDPIEALRTE